MRRACLISLALVFVCFAMASGAWAVERQLAGVSLGERALDLLGKTGFGQPNYIGPIGSIGLPSASGQGGAGTAAGRARRSGPAGPNDTTASNPSLLGGMRGGMRGGGMQGGDMSGDMGGGGMGGGGMRGGGMGGGMRGGGMRGGGGGGRGGMRGGGGGAAGARAASGGTGMYWYYRRPSAAVMVLSLTPTGEVKSITLSGNLPYAAGRTTRSIGLASSYMDVIGRYGYPDQTMTAGNAIELTYVDDGVRFTLEGMRVTRIAIGAEIVRAVEAVPAQAVSAPEPAGPSVGLTPEELRGYL